MSGYRNLHRQQVVRIAPSNSNNKDETPANVTPDSISDSSFSSPTACPIWHVQTTSRLVTNSGSKTTLIRGSSSASSSSSPSWRIWTASGDGLVRSYLVQEKSLDDKKEEDVLDASALQLSCTHIFLGDYQEAPADLSSSISCQTTTETVLGCTRVTLVRNYVGDDENAGQTLLASMELAGRIRIWQLENIDDTAVIDSSHKKKVNKGSSSSSSSSSSIATIKATHEFVCRDATGTTLVWCPPRLFGNGPVVLATACLDGTIALIASGITTPVLPGTAGASTNKSNNNNARNEIAPGTVVATIGNSGAAIGLSLAFAPNQKLLAVGRQDGSLDMFHWSSGGGNNSGSRGFLDSLSSPRHMRLSPHMHAPIRALSFTTDGHLVMAGNDEGMICIWNIIMDSSNRDRNNHRVPPQLVHHVMEAHASWILDLVAIDQRRFVSCGMDRQLHVWNVGQIYQPVHSFSSDHVVWTISSTMLPPSSPSNINSLSPQQQPYRLVSGSEEGWLQVYSLDSKG